MDLTNKQTLKSLCSKYHVWPSRRMSQNFLYSQDVIKKIIDIAELKEEDLVLEIGPGLGTLTTNILPKVKKLIAVEIDSRFYKILADNIKHPNLELIRGDILSQDTEEKIFKIIGGKPYKIVANLPFGITSRFLRIFLEAEQPEKMVLIIQKEVAERIVALPGKMSLLSISVKFYAKPYLVQTILRENFWPEPKVDCALLEISSIKKNYYPLTPLQIKDFFRIVKTSFSSPRKQLKNNLANIVKVSPLTIQKFLQDLGLNPKIRAQELTLTDWLSLYKILALKKQLTTSF